MIKSFPGVTILKSCCQTCPSIFICFITCVKIFLINSSYSCLIHMCIQIQETLGKTYQCNWHGLKIKFKAMIYYKLGDKDILNCYTMKCRNRQVQIINIRCIIQIYWIHSIALVIKSALIKFIIIFMCPSFSYQVIIFQDLLFLSEFCIT